MTIVAYYEASLVDNQSVELIENRLTKINWGNLVTLTKIKPKEKNDYKMKFCFYFKDKTELEKLNQDLNKNYFIHDLNVKIRNEFD